MELRDRCANLSHILKLYLVGITRWIHTPTPAHGRVLATTPTAWDFYTRCRLAISTDQQWWLSRPWPGLPSTQTPPGPSHRRQVNSTRSDPLSHLQPAYLGNCRLWYHSLYGPCRHQIPKKKKRGVTTRLRTEVSFFCFVFLLICSSVLMVYLAFIC